MKTDKEVIRVNGKLKEIVTIRDHKGNIMQKIVTPLMVEFYPRDLMQAIIGATILAIPVAFTEETWNLGATLPGLNVFFLGLLSVIFISAFVYYNFYRNGVKGHVGEFFKRILSIYLVSLIVVGLILVIIQRAPFGTDYIMAVKRVVIVAFPASMSAAISDMIK